MIESGFGHGFAPMDAELDRLTQERLCQIH